MKDRKQVLIRLQQAETALEACAAGYTESPQDTQSQRIRKKLALRDAALEYIKARCTAAGEPEPNLVAFNETLDRIFASAQTR